MEITKNTLVNDLRKLGLTEGDTVFVRISYKSIGKVEGGPRAVVEALLEVIGTNGTLLATAFPKRIYSFEKVFYRNLIYKKGMKPTTGIIPVIMSSYPNAHFSLNPIAPYVAIGCHAEQITSAHTIDSGSYDIVYYMLRNFSPKCLRIGGNTLDGTTHLAFSEGLKNTGQYQVRLPEGIYYLRNGKKEWKEKTSSAFCHIGFAAFFDKYIYPSDAVLGEGYVGKGKAMLTSMNSTFEIEKKYIASNPQIISCTSENCVNCRTSFSYSESSKFRFALKNLRNLFSKSWRDVVEMYVRFVLLFLFGRKCE